MRKLNNQLIKPTFIFCFVLIYLCCSVFPATAKPVSCQNPESGYSYVLDDEADFLDKTDEYALETKMNSISDYCNVAIVTTKSHNKSSTAEFAESYYNNVFGAGTNGTIFVIDRCLNEIYLYSDGKAHKTITNARAYSITDKTYIYATKSYNYDYFNCCLETLKLIQSTLEGHKFAEPMRYICSALFALLLALLINYFIVMFFSRTRKPDLKQTLSGIYTSFYIKNNDIRFVNQTRVYSPPSESSGSSSGGSSGGSSHSGGGGGHSI